MNKHHQTDNAQFKSGFISIIGRPNVGKSTFLNRVIGQKIAIMSDKPQTTRNKVQGVLTTNDAQMIFIDTPGIHKPKHKLGDFMMKVATNTLKEVDLILFMINADEGYGRGDEFIIEKLKGVTTPVFLVINKIDQVEPDQLLPMIEQYQSFMTLKKLFLFRHWKEIMLIACLTKSKCNCQRDRNIIQPIKLLIIRKDLSSRS